MGSGIELRLPESHIINCLYLLNYFASPMYDYHMMRLSFDGSISPALHFPNFLNHVLFSYFVFECIYVCVPWHACGGQETIWGARSLYHGGKGIELRFSGFQVRDILLAQSSYFWKSQHHPTHPVDTHFFHSKIIKYLMYISWWLKFILISKH